MVNDAHGFNAAHEIDHGICPARLRIFLGQAGNGQNSKTG